MLFASVIFATDALNLAPDIPLIGLTAPTLVGLAVLFLMTGRIVPRTTYQEKIKEAADWRQAYENEREARAKSEQHMVELLEVSKANYAIVHAVFGKGGALQRTGGSDVVPPQ